MNTSNKLESKKEPHLTKSNEMKTFSENSLKELCDLIPTPIFWKDKSGKILGGNKAFKENAQPNSLATEKDITIVDAHGHEIRIVGTVTLPTQPEKSDEARLYLSNILKTSPSNIYWKDKEGRYLGSNEANTKLCLRANAHLRDVIGLTDYDFYDKKTADHLRENDLSVMKTGSPILCEEQIKLPGGEKITYVSHKIPLHDPDGKVIGVLGSSIDITKQKSLEAELIQAKEIAEKDKKTTEIYLKSILSNLPDHVFWEDRDGNLLGCNDQQAKSFGYETAEDIIGKNVVDLGRNMGWDDEMINNLRNNDKYVLEHGKTLIAEEPLIFSDKKVRYMYSKKVPLKDEQGSTIGMLGLAFDITQRKEMEQKLREAKEKAETANIAKSNFIANISHDLRTPLHTILGTAELMQVREHPREQNELIEGILHAGQNLLKLIENILSFSELESSSTESVNDHFDLRHVVETIVLEHTPRAEEKNIDLIISYRDFVPHYVIGNLQNIRRIINNLLENAIKFTDKGYVMVAVECLHTEGDHAMLQINVEDTGIGISKIDLDHIFDRFYRATPSYINRYKGTGLGLAIIKQLTENLGGNLRVHSQQGYGTTFYCTIPFKLTESLANAETLRQQFNHARILIIDDHRPRRQVLLKQFPGQNVTAVNSKNAFATFEAAEKIQEQFNLIVVDEDIKANTPETLAKLLMSESSLPQPPVMVLCRKTNGINASEEQKKLFQQILKKPLAPSDLATRIMPTWQRWLTAYQRKTHPLLERKLSVLLVEDDKLIQKFTTSLLLDTGCEVDIADTGKMALEKAGNDYDLVLMDIGLPDIDGLTTTQEYRKLLKGKDKQPIIVALTAHVSNEDKKRCLDAGLDDFLKKPAAYNDFQTLLNKFFKH